MNNKNQAEKIIKVFHGPNNTGGIGYRLSRLQRQHGLQADFWTLKEHPRKKGRDICLHGQQTGKFKSLLIQIGMFIFCLFNYDIFHFYFGQSLLPFNLDLPFIKLLGKKIVMTYCGSDIRLLNVDQNRHPFPTLLEEAGYTRLNNIKNVMRMAWHRIWINQVTAPRGLYAYARQIFPKSMISTIWINNIDIFSKSESDFSVDLPVANNAHHERLLKIVHAPTSKQRKGTHLIEAAIEALQTEGMEFDYQRIEGLTYADARRLIEASDIIIDQIVIGDIGSLSLEALSMGKTVCVYVMDEIIDMLNGDIPILNINPENLKEQLRLAISDQALRAQLAKEGPKFIGKYLDIELILNEVENLYGIN